MESPSLKPSTFFLNTAADPKTATFSSLLHFLLGLPPFAFLIVLIKQMMRGAEGRKDLFGLSWESRVSHGEVRAVRVEGTWTH